MTINSGTGCFEAAAGIPCLVVVVVAVGCNALTQLCAPKHRTFLPSFDCCGVGLRINTGLRRNTRAAPAEQIELPRFFYGAGYLIFFTVRFRERSNSKVFRSRELKLERGENSEPLSALLGGFAALCCYYYHRQGPEGEKDKEGNASYVPCVYINM